MPARASSLRITERYRNDMVRLRQQGQREAKRIWRSVSPGDLDGTFNLGVLEMTVSTLQKEAARLSSAYLSAFIASELGEPQNPPALSVWEKTFNGNPLREGLRSAVVKAKMAIKDGTDPTQATNDSRDILVSDVGLFIDTAARESLRQGMEMDDRIVGYKRAIKGTCEACMGMADGSTLPEGTPLDIHPNCECVSEPVVRGKPGMSDAQFAAVQWYETGYGVEDMNLLRQAISEGKTLTSLPRESQERIRDITALIDRNTERAPTLYRTQEAAKLELGPEGLPLVGEDWTEWGVSAAAQERRFASTWVESMKLDEPVLFKIKGARGMNLDALMRREGIEVEDPTEANFTEWLLRPGTRFEVNSMKQATIGGRRGWEIELRAK